MSMEPLITSQQVIDSGVLPISALTLRRYAESGRVRAYKPGRAWLFRISEVVEDITQRYSNRRVSGQYPQKKRPQEKSVAGKLVRGWR